MNDKNVNNKEFTALFKSGNLNVDEWTEISKIYSGKSDYNNEENANPNAEGMEEVDLQIDVTNLTPMEPEDGGWGWLVVMGSFMLLGLTDGICLSYGFFLTALQESFSGVSNLEMMFASSVLGGSYLIMGPVASAMTNQFGFRPLVICGGAVSTVSILISGFMPNITGFILTFGLFTGLGYSLSYLPGSTIIALWFRKRRATATGIALCGSSFCAAVFSQIIPILIDYYSWRGCLLILAAINCNIFVAAAIFRPIVYPEAEVNITKPEAGSAENQDMSKLLEDLALQTIMETIKNDTNQTSQSQNARRQSIIDMVLNPKPTDRFQSNGSINTMIITTQNDVSGKNIDQSEVNKMQMVQNILSKYLNTHVNTSKNSNQFTKSNINLIGSSTLFPVGNTIHSQTSLNYAVVSQPQLFHNSAFNLHRSVLSLAPLKEHKICINKDMVKEISHHLGKEMARPHLRKDLFYQGSVNHLNRENLYRPRSESRLKQVNIEKMVEADSPTSGALQNLMDFSILKSKTMQLFLALNFFSMFGFMIPYQFLILYANGIGLTTFQSASLLTMMGLASCVGRILSGCIADFPWSNCLVIHNCAIISAGLGTMIIPLLSNYPGLVFYVILYGISTASFISLKTIVIVDVMGSEKLTNVFGWTILAQGFAILFGPPLMASIFDYVQNLNVVFGVGGLIMSISGFLGAPLNKIAIREHFNDV